MKHIPLTARFEKLCSSLPERALRDLGLYGSVFSGKIAYILKNTLITWREAALFSETFLI